MFTQLIKTYTNQLVFDYFIQTLKKKKNEKLHILEKD